MGGRTAWKSGRPPAESARFGGRPGIFHFKRWKVIFGAIPANSLQNAAATS